MKEVELFSSANASSSISSVEYLIGDLREYSVHVKFSDSSLNGDLGLEASNDAVDWVEIPESVQTVASGMSHIWSVMGAGYKFVRVSWTHSAGSGTILAKLVLKEFPIKHG